MTLRYEPSSEPLLIPVKHLFFLLEQTHPTKRPANRMVEFEGFRWGVLRDHIYTTRGLELNCAKHVDFRWKVVLHCVATSTPVQGYLAHKLPPPP